MDMYDFVGAYSAWKNVLYKCDVWFIERSFTQLMDGHTRGFTQ